MNSSQRPFLFKSFPKKWQHQQWKQHLIPIYPSQADGLAAFGACLKVVESCTGRASVDHSVMTLSSGVMMKFGK